MALQHATNTKSHHRMIVSDEDADVGLRFGCGRATLPDSGFKSGQRLLHAFLIMQSSYPLHLVTELGDLRHADGRATPFEPVGQSA